MKRTLKIAAIVLGALLGLVILALIVAAILVDPNDYKDDITGAVKQATGRTLSIPGRLKLSLFPWIGIETGRLELSNAQGFGAAPMARVESAGIKLAVLPLLTGRVEVGTIQLTGLELHLIKAASGRTNLDDLLEPKPGAAKPAPKAKTKTEAGPALDALAIGGVDVRRANLSWHDQGSGDRYALRNVDLRTGRIALGQPIALQLSVQLEQSNPPRRFPVALAGALTVTEQDFRLGGIDLKLDDSRVTGSVSAKFGEPHYRFELLVDQLDVDKYLPPAAPSAPGAKTAAAPPAPVEIPLGLLRALNVKGKLGIGRLTAFGLRSEQIAIEAQARGGLIELGPNRAKLYGGSYEGKTKLDVRGKQAAWHFEEKLQKVQLAPLLKDAQVFDAFTGAANIALALSAQGFDAAAITRSLNGTTSFTIDDGAIEGIDILKIEKTLKEAKAREGKTLKNVARALPDLAPEKGDKTSFSKLEASAKLINGVVHNNDLAIRAPHLNVKGAGRINLVEERFDDYVIQTGSIGVKISGPFNNRSYTPVIDEKAIKKKLERKFEEKIEDKLEDKLRKKLRRR